VMCKVQDNLRNWLQTVSVDLALTNAKGQTYSCVHDVVLDSGRFFASSPLSDTQRSIVLAAVRRARSTGAEFAPQRCFDNATRLVLADRMGELSYVEGFAIGTVMPVHHAWATIGGKVVDLTWTHPTASTVTHEMSDRVLGEFGSNRTYVGIPFPRTRVHHRFSELGSAQPFFEDVAWFTARFRTPRKSKAPWCSLLDRWSS